ncbi:MAG: hypothetical protein IIC82_03385 [Chloroflexi bacterium]|nr:hypothetical protein [Chloroflexota bacterium]
MGQIEDAIAEDLANSPIRHSIFLYDTETVTYKPKVGSSRSIKMKIDRSPDEIEKLEGLPFGQVVYVGSVVNDAVLGMTGVNVGQDVVALKENLWDSTDTDFVITAVLSQDVRELRLELRK